MEQRAPVLEVRRVTKLFPGVLALDDISFELRPGEVHALVGENGAGKSTMIKVVTGVYAPDEGQILFDGEEVSFSQPRESQEAGISTIYQEINLIPLLSVAQNVFLGREPRGCLGLIDRDRMKREAAEILKRYGIRADVTAPLRSLGLGVQQMVAIARAISVDARAVIMDEPTSSLEAREVETLFGVIRQLREEELAELSRVQLIAHMLGRELSEVQEEGATGFGEEHKAAEEPVLQAQDLTQHPRLRNISFNVRPGEVVGLAGLLGAGRSETAKAIFGAEPVDSGVLKVGGEHVKMGSPAAAIKAGVAFLPEDRKLEGIIPDLSVRENIVAAALPRLARAGMVSEKAQDELVEGFMQSLGIKASSSAQPVRELSGGNQQKVLLARWLCMNPKVLMLDEPTRGIDVGAKAEIQKLVDDLAVKGLGVILISSELEEMTEGSDRVVVLRDGAVVGLLSEEEITEGNLMELLAHGEDSGDGAQENGESADG
jgi:monosaccharide-transporting ATPase